MQLLSGWVWVGIPIVQALLVTLIAGSKVIVDVVGRPFRYGKTSIYSVAWHDQKHSALE